MGKRASLLGLFLGGLASLPHPALAGDCKEPEVLSNGTCCPRGSTFNADRGLCVINPAAASTAAPAAPAAIEALKDAPASPPMPHSQFYVQPAFTCDGHPCTGARIWIDGEQERLTSDQWLSFRSPRSLVRIDIRAPGYMDTQAYVRVEDEEAITLRANLPHLPNLRVILDSFVPPNANVYVISDDDGRTIDGCAIDSSDKKADCSLVVPLLAGKNELTTHLRIAGNVRADVPGVTITAKGTTEVHLTFEKGSPPALLWYGLPAVLTLATLIVAVVGSTDGTPAVQITGASLGALDVIVGGIGFWQMAQLTNAARVDERVEPYQKTDQVRENTRSRSVPAELAATPRRGPVVSGALTPSGFVLRW